MHDFFHSLFNFHSGTSSPAGGSPGGEGGTDFTFEKQTPRYARLLLSRLLARPLAATLSREG